jgi:hypothetical protein
VIPDEKIKDLYLHHAGTVASQRAAGTVDAPFVLLELCSVKTGEPAYATLGASAGPLQHEIFLGSLVPFPQLAEAVEAVARAALIASARLHGLDPEAYLRDLFRVLAHWPKGRYLELAPRYWAATRARLMPEQLDVEIGDLTVPPPLPSEEQPASR